MKTKPDMKKINIILTMILIAFYGLSSSNASAQPIDRTSYYTYGRPFFAEAHLVPSNQPDSVRLIVFFKTMYDFVDFKPSSNGKTGYAGFSSVEISIKNDLGVIKKRLMSRDTAFTALFEHTNSKTLFLNGAAETLLAKGDYDVKAALLDDYGKQIDVVDIKSEELKKSGLILASEARGEVGLFMPFIIGGNVDFERQRANALISVENAAQSYTFSVKTVQNLQSRINWPGEFSTSGSAKIRNSELSIIKYPGNPQPYLSYNNKNGKVSVIEIDLPVNSMNPGKYSLELTGDGRTDTFSFEILWESMPLYLRNIDEAAKVMQYVLTNEQYSDLVNKSSQKKFEYILNYFKPKDPTPETSYNEALAVYFKRADYAFFNYQTLTEKNGALTDRGKIYILFGAPDKVSNDLTKGVSSEIWRYERADRIFKFEMVRSGVYQLVEALTLKGQVVESK